MKLSVLIPMYNEAEIAGNTARVLKTFLDGKFPERDYEIVFCDDGSTDGCRDIIDGLGLENVRTVGYTDNRGKGSAVRFGILRCAGEKIVYTDCDLAYGTDAIFGIFEASGDNDVTIGSRALHPDGYAGYTPLRRLMSKVYIRILSVIAGFKYSDSQCGLKCLTREAAERVFTKCTVNGFAFDLEMLVLADKAGMKVGEFPAKIISNRERLSKVSPVKDAFRMLRDVLKIKKTHRNTEV
ncbi:MAG: glycosyltransferase [Clostridia bacterium]|nr:glycosyltransferase [Clostridia bacterium]